MTDQEIYEVFISWSKVLGIDIILTTRENLEEMTRTPARGCFIKDKESLGHRPPTGTIFLWDALPVEGKISTIAHEFLHFHLYVRNIKYQYASHEPVAFLFQRYLLALMRGEADQLQNEVGGIFQLVKGFLDYLGSKMDSTFQGNLELHQGYLAWLKEKEGKEG